MKIKKFLGIQSDLGWLFSRPVRKASKNLAVAIIFGSLDVFSIIVLLKWVLPLNNSWEWLIVKRNSYNNNSLTRISSGLLLLVLTYFSSVLEQGLADEAMNRSCSVRGAWIRWCISESVLVSVHLLVNLGMKKCIKMILKILISF